MDKRRPGSVRRMSFNKELIYLHLLFKDKTLNLE